MRKRKKNNHSYFLSLALALLIHNKPFNKLTVLRGSYENVVDRGGNKANFSFVNLVFIFRGSSSTTNPVCERRVDLLVCSLPLHRHSYIGFILAFASSFHNKQQRILTRSVSQTISPLHPNEDMARALHSILPLLTQHPR